VSTATSPVEGRERKAKSDVLLGLGLGRLALGGDGEEHAVLAQGRAQDLGVLRVADALHRLAGRDEDASVLEYGHGFWTIEE
jgi:hypothetical protein